MDPGLDYYSVYGKLRRTDDDDGGGGGGVTGLSSVCGLHHPAGTLGGAAPPSELSDHRTLYFILFSVGEVKEIFLLLLLAKTPGKCLDC